MKKKTTRIKSDGYNNLYLSNIMLRFMSAEEMQKFHDRYKAALYHSKMNLEPSDEQLELAREYKKNPNYREVAKANKVPAQKVYYAVRRVAMYDYLNK